MKRHKRLIVHRQAVVNNLTTGKPMIKGNVLKRELTVGPPTLPAPVPPLYGGEVDNYSTGFVRVYWNPAEHSGDLFDGQYHMMKFSLAMTPNTGGAVFADTDAIRALGGVAWFDNNGTLGKVILRQNNQPPEHEMTANEMADSIDAGANLSVKPEGVNLIVVGIIP